MQNCKLVITITNFLQLFFLAVLEKAPPLNVPSPKLMEDGVPFHQRTPFIMMPSS